MENSFRSSGYLPLRDYAALGDGRSVALVGPDGAVDWWCVPDMHAPPLFDRLWDAEHGGAFIIVPVNDYSVQRRYSLDSNVFETVFTTATGKARLVESINSGSAGRLPWCELARRIVGIEGTVTFSARLTFSQASGVDHPHLTSNENGVVFHIDGVLGMVLSSGGVNISKQDEQSFVATFTVAAGQRETIAVIAGRNEPLVIPSINDIDRRIDLTDREWRDWSDQVSFHGTRRAELLRHALSLKLLLYSPTGAIAAASTASLPEHIGGDRNYDYRFAWIRDSGYVIKAFLAINQQAEAKAAFTWIIKCIDQHGIHVLYTLDGQKAYDVRQLQRQGYRHSTPVRIGNAAAMQCQNGVYGDVFELADSFVKAGNILDPHTAAILVGLANQAAKCWHNADSGIWELEETQHYTNSKISCWQALDRALHLAEKGHIPDTDSALWKRERNSIIDWIDQYCWSETKQAYIAYAGSEELDASLVLGIRFGFPRIERLSLTLAAIEHELAAGPFHYRCSWSRGIEGCFLACTLWIIMAKLTLGRGQEAEQNYKNFSAALGKHNGILPEMIDPQNGDFLGNMPLGLTHLAMVQVILALEKYQAA